MLHLFCSRPGTSDGGSNFVAVRVWPEGSRLRCFAHIWALSLNTVVSIFYFRNSKLVRNVVPTLNNCACALWKKAGKKYPLIKTLWRQAKKLVAKWYKWGLKLKSGKVIIKHCKTRWLTRYLMLKCILENFDDIKAELGARRIQNYFNDLLSFEESKTGFFSFLSHIASTGCLSFSGAMCGRFRRKCGSSLLLWIH